MQELIDYLRGCPTGFDQYRGLCDNIICPPTLRKFTIAERKAFNAALKAVLPSWQYFSGCNITPIRMDDTLTPEDYYLISKRYGTMYEGEYGRRRIELANLIADELEKQLCKN